MTSDQKSVLEFHHKFECYAGEVPHVPPSEVRDLRVSLIVEELEELITASDRGDIVEAADALADLQYVILGAACAWGIDLEPIFHEVHRSNMSKLFPDGTVHRRADGKVIKPPTYSKADLKPILTRQGMRLTD